MAEMVMVTQSFADFNFVSSEINGQVNFLNRKNRILVYVSYVYSQNGQDHAGHKSDIRY